MSKVIHLPEATHRLAKTFCRENGLKMSDWVGTLIDEASAGSQPQPPAPPRKKVLAKLRDLPQTDNDGVPLTEKPPFWERDR